MNQLNMRFNTPFQAINWDLSCVSKIQKFMEMPKNSILLILIELENMAFVFLTNILIDLLSFY